jgi:hypothetical protein
MNASYFSHCMNNALTHVAFDKIVGEYRINSLKGVQAYLLLNNNRE